MGVMLSAAGSLRWYRDTVAPGVGYDELLAPAADVPIGSEGLVFLPYLTGERTPHPDPLARGSFIGLTVRHTQPHMTRSVIEGVAFGLRDSFELMKGAGLSEITRCASPAAARAARSGARSWPMSSTASWSPSTRPKARPTARRCWPASAPVSGPT
jgi:sugar (pentulose or hexulose) kinase